MSTTFYLVALTVVCGLGALSLNRRARRPEPLLHADDRCVACESPDIAHPMPGVYVCSACGHEGGDGLAAFERTRWKDEVEAWSPDERARRGRECLEEGRRMLISADGFLATAHDAVHNTDGSDGAAALERADEAVTDVIEDLFRAHGLLIDAAWLLARRDVAIALPLGGGDRRQTDLAALERLRGALEEVVVELGAPVR